MKKLFLLIYALFSFLFGFGGVVNAADTVVSGVISMPSTVAPYSEGKLIRVAFMTGWTGEYFKNDYYCTSVMLPAERESVSYHCSIPDLAGEFAIYVKTMTSMPGVYDYAYYNSLETTPDADLSEHLSAGSIHIDKDIKLIPTLTVNVVMQTPPGESFNTDQDIALDIFGNVTSEAGDINWTYAAGMDAKWLAGSERFEYTFESPYIDGDVIVKYRFADGFGLGYLREGYYSDTGIVPTIDQATILSSKTIKLDLTMFLDKSVQLSGIGSQISIISLLLLND